ncbi:MAG TPA: phosphoglucosamine mutase [Clostridia bacterium]|nr:phosphoglucosamine mutase [Clostridia bacterium]
MARLFGTDGVRGIANRDLSCELAMKIGACGAYVLTSEVHNPRILVGMDTRRSGDMLGAALTAGICSVGGDVIDVGVIPTPALAYLVRLYEADAAVMVSASHNTMEYNGIKWFSAKGYKLPDEIEDEIERMIQDDAPLQRPTGADVGHVIKAKRAASEYASFLRSTARIRFDGLRVVLDCANGASSRIAHEVFSELGADVISCADEPDGSNINDKCGSLHPERLQELVTETGADAGFAFDGDADRVIAADEFGNIVDGDRILGICALAMKEEGRLKNDTLVITVMSNLGLKVRMKERGVRISETAVGDRYVMECMLKENYALGGEQSGHVIFLDLNTTGDGMLTAIQVLNILQSTKKSMSQLASEIPIYPQVLINVRVENERKQAAINDAELKDAIQLIGGELGTSGRVLVRASGTEPLIRIMLEGQDEAIISRHAITLAKILEHNHEGKIKG